MYFSLAKKARKALTLVAGTGALLVFGLHGATALAETCTISPSNATVSTGDTVAFSASTDLKGKKTYD